MASLSCFTQFCSLPRWRSNFPSLSPLRFVQFRDVRLHGGFVVTAARRKKLAEEASDGEGVDSEKKTTRKRAPLRRRKKTESDAEENSILASTISDVDEEPLSASQSTEAPEKPKRRGRKKVASTSSSLDEEPVKRVTRRRRTTRKIDDAIDEGGETELSEREDDTDNEKELEIDAGGEDISFTYAWPPLVCCFGSVQHAFVPSGRRANRLIDHESHERMKDALWIPEKFVRAPGSGAGGVALCLTSMGSNVAVMGKIGDDDFGQALLYHLNVNKVQTRAIRIDPERATAVSWMKMRKRGGLRMTCVNPCAEDMLSKSEINVDVLKEAKMFYFDSFSLLDWKMRRTALQAVKISKQFGGVIFYDLNLPLPLWHSREETQTIIQEALELADIIEVTKQELEFLCGIVPYERFDTNDNDRLKFVHHDLEAVAPIRHDNLKVLFVTNGTSKIHYYTKEHHGSVLGMEDPPITPFTSDMSAAGDGIIAALMSKLTVQPHLMTDKEYLEHSIAYAINRGITAQWLQARTRGYPPKPGMEDDDLDPDPNCIKTITEKEYRTLVPVHDHDSEDVGAQMEGHVEESTPEVANAHGDDSEDGGVNMERHDEEPMPEVIGA